MHNLQGDSKERLREVDIVRGFAVLGICVVNIPEMLGNGVAFESEYTGSNALFRLLYDMFIQTKFYTLFAFFIRVELLFVHAQCRAAGLRCQENDDQETAAPSYRRYCPWGLDMVRGCAACLRHTGVHPSAFL